MGIFYPFPFLLLVELWLWIKWSSLWQDIDWLCTIINKRRICRTTAVVRVTQKLLWYSIIKCCAKQRQDYGLINSQYITISDTYCVCNHMQSFISCRYGRLWMVKQKVQSVSDENECIAALTSVIVPVTYCLRWLYM